MLVVRPQPGQADYRRERAQPHGLQDLLRHDHFLRAVAARLRRERDADGVADAFLQQTREPAVEATMPLEPMPASVRPRCSA